MTYGKHRAELLDLTTKDPRAYGEARRKLRAELDSRWAERRPFWATHRSNGELD